MQATLARPYAQALFVLGVEQDQLAIWRDYLHVLAQLIVDPQIVNWVSNPQIDAGVFIELAHDLAKKAVSRFKRITAFSQELLLLLFENKRIFLLPDIAHRFSWLVENHEKTITVELRSAFPVKKARQKAFENVLTRYFSRDVVLEVVVDEQLLGGAILRAGDQVIDGSIHGKLNRLRHKIKKG